jgi:hypothetical protein
MGNLLKDYSGIVSWPPLPGGAFNGHEPPPFPVDEKVMATKVFPVMSEFVTFSCEFHGTQHSYDLQMEDKATAEEFARWLEKHVGKTLEQFGEFRLDC